MPDRDVSTNGPTIVLAIDGLRAAALGAYGQTGYETPAFDALAAESLTLDACYAATPAPADLYDGLSQRWATTLLTDDAAATESLVAGAERAITLDTPPVEAVADSIEATSTASTWMALAEHVVELAEGDFPDLLWIHVRGLYGPWDAPPELYEPLFDEDDPEVAATVEPPDAHFQDAASDEACDARFAAACRYAGQVMALDACLGGWLDVLDGLFEGEAFRLVVVGLRGFPLGEHGRVGGVDPRLFSEQQHVPVFVRDADPSGRFTRDPRPVTLSSFLQSLLAGDRPSSDSARLVSPDAEALVTDSWLLRKPAAGDPELYVKPDDRWEQNDIASLEEAAAESLLATLAADSGVATPPAAR